MSVISELNEKEKKKHYFIPACVNDAARVWVQIWRRALQTHKTEMKRKKWKQIKINEKNWQTTEKKIQLFIQIYDSSWMIKIIFYFFLFSFNFKLKKIAGASLGMEMLELWGHEKPASHYDADDVFILLRFTPLSSSEVNFSMLHWLHIKHTFSLC